MLCYTDINAEEDRKNPNGIFCFYQKLIALRKKEDLVSEGVYKPLADNHSSVWCYAREGEEEALLVIGNFYEKEITYQLPTDFCNTYQIREILLGNYELQMPKENQIVLHAYECIVYKGKKRGN